MIKLFCIFQCPRRISDLRPPSRLQLHLCLPLPGGRSSSGLLHHPGQLQEDLHHHHHQEPRQCQCQIPARKYRGSEYCLFIWTCSQTHHHPHCLQHPHLPLCSHHRSRGPLWLCCHLWVCAATHKIISFKLIKYLTISVSYNMKPDDNCIKVCPWAVR